MERNGADPYRVCPLFSLPLQVAVEKIVDRLYRNRNTFSGPYHSPICYVYLPRYPL